MSNMVKSNVIDVSMNKLFSVKLSDYIEKEDTFPISIFYKTSMSQAIADAITFLNARKSGIVYIPPEGINPEVRITARSNKDGLVAINYIINNYRYPINQESRPYSGGNWKVGDIVINNDITTNKCYGWICIVNGTPGTWNMVGAITPHISYTEVVESLPEASIIQHGRTVIYHDDELGIYSDQIVVCMLTDEGYNWVCQTTIVGKTTERPSTLPFLGWYFDEDTKKTYWFNGSTWVLSASSEGGGYDYILSEDEPTEDGLWFKLKTKSVRVVTYEDRYTVGDILIVKASTGELILSDFSTYHIGNDSSAVGLVIPIPSSTLASDDPTEIKSTDIPRVTTIGSSAGLYNVVKSITSR